MELRMTNACRMAKLLRCYILLLVTWLLVIFIIIVCSKLNSKDLLTNKHNEYDFDGLDDQFGFSDETLNISQKGTDSQQKVLETISILADHVDNLYSYHVTEESMETFNAKLPPALPGFRNHCWLEHYPDEKTFSKTWFADLGYYKCLEPLINHFKALEAQSRRKTRELKWRLRCFPSFFVLGVAKSGSTDLFASLVTNHGIARPLLKEVMFWSAIRFGAPYLRKACTIASVPPAKLSDYLDFFDSAATTILSRSTGTGQHKTYPLITGDFSPDTLYALAQWDKIHGNEGLSEPRYITAHHIHQLLPTAKFIIIMRDPVERAYSEYRFWLGGNVRISSEDFHDRIEDGLRSLQSCLDQMKCTRCCLYKKDVEFYNSNLLIRGIYSVFIKDWLQVFPKDQFLFLQTEQYEVDKLKEMNKVVDFLNIEPWSSHDIRLLTEQRHLHMSEKKSDMLDKTRLLLQDFFRPWNRQLAQIDGSDRFLWGYS